MTTAQASSTSVPRVDATATGDAAQESFRLEEFKILRGESLWSVQELRRLERETVIASTAIITFLTQRPGTGDSLLTKLLAAFGFASEGKPDWFGQVLDLAWFLPPAVALLSLIRWCETQGDIMRCARYVAGYERRVAPSDGGWETYSAGLRPRTGEDIPTPGEQVFWCLVMVLTLAVAFHHLGSIWRAAPDGLLALAGGVLGFAGAYFTLAHYRRTIRNAGNRHSKAPAAGSTG